MSNGKSTPRKYSKQEYETASYRTLQSSPTYLPSGVNSLEEWLTSLRQASPAHHSQQQGLNEVLKIPETSGQTRSELYVKWLPGMSSWRMSQAYLMPLENEEHQAMGALWLENLPKQGMIVSGKLSELTMSVRHTEERDGSALESWPTPTANEDAAGLPTGNMQPMLGNHPNLRNVTGESQSGRQAQSKQTSGQESWQSDQTSPPLLPKTLSPIFVEWLMGVPINWTSLKPLETESYHQWWHNFSSNS